MHPAEPETPYRIEPCMLEQYPVQLADLIGELIGAGVSLGQRLHPRTAASLGELVRVMNCYYSNLIEGHNTRPRDIERALADDLDAIESRRDLQLEARAHIRVQQEIDARFASGSLGQPTSQAFVRWIHQAFYAEAPQRLLQIEHASGAYMMTPGEFRSEPRHDVAVGRHHPPSSKHVAELMSYFERRYRTAPESSGA